MQCFYHNKEAVTTCNNCGKGLCKDCMFTINGRNYCPDCFRGYVDWQKTDLARDKKYLNIGKILGVIAFVICFTSGIRIIFSLIVALWVACIPISFYCVRDYTKDAFYESTMDDKITNFKDSVIASILGAPIMAITVIKGLGQKKINIANNEELLARYINH